MHNITPDELRSLANRIPWEELLPPKYAEITGRGYTKDGMRQTLNWRITANGESVEGFTEGEDGLFIVADPSAHKFQKLTKFDALKSLSLADEDWRDCPTDWRGPFLPQHDGAWGRYATLSNLFCWDSPGVTAQRTWPIAPDQGTLETR